MLAALAGCGAPPATLEEARGRRLVVVGLDGATWDLLDPWIEAGDLPTLGGLISRGARAELRAEPQHALSGPSWTSLASGKRAARHGITHNRGDPRVARFWDVLGGEGMKSLVVGWVLTHPVRPLHGVMLSGPFGDPASHPPDLLAALEAELGPYQPDAEVRGVGQALVASAHASSHRQMAYLRALLPRDHWSIAAVVVVAPDRLAHFFWKFHEPERFGLAADSEGVARFGPVLRDWWRAFDGELAALLDEIDLESHTLFLVSDHGFEAAEPGRLRCKNLELDYLLREAGWLELDAANRPLPRRTRARASTTRDSGEGRVWREGRVIVSDPTLLEPARVLLEEAAIEPGGVRCFERVRIEAGEVRFDVLARPTLDLEASLRVSSEGGIRRVPLSELVTRSKLRSGVHTPRGLLLAVGAGVRPGVRVGPFEGVQLTPTLLSALGIPLAQDMDGVPARDLFRPGWLPELPDPVPSYDDRVPESDGTAPEPEGLEERLRGLGYLD